MSEPESVPNDVAAPPGPAAVEARIPIEALIAALSRPEAFGVEGPVEVVQTHVSAVFLAGDRAYKVKKPIRLWGFLDYGTVAVREHWCETEVRLNRRLAPDVYLGVEPIVRRADGAIRVGGPGDVLDHAVVMRRWAPGSTYLDRLRAGTLAPEDVRAAARVLASFHGRCRLAPEDAGFARPSGIGRVVRQNFLSTRREVPELFPAAVHEGIARRTAGRLCAVRGLVRARVAAGRMVDGHGDVRLEHVLSRDGRVEIVDAIEFSEWIRHVDPLNDMAFLSMDLTDQGRPDLARVLEASYLEHAGEDEAVAAALLPLYRAYRAHVRAKVDAQTYRSPEVPEAVRREKAVGARRYLALAWRYAREGETPPVVVLRGPSGVGKSVLASRVAPLLDAGVVRSDVVRKELAGLGPTDRVEGAAVAALYGRAMSERTYARLIERAEEVVEAGRAAILDATYLRRDARLDARMLARRLGAPFAIVDVTANDAEVRRRLSARTAAATDASDADASVYEMQLREAEAITEDERAFTVPYDSERPAETALLPLLEVLERGP